LRLTTLLLLIGTTLLLSSAVMAEDQQRSVTGRIVDNTGQALPGVNILEKGTINGAISDVDGKFTLNVASSSSVLVFHLSDILPRK